MNKYENFSKIEENKEIVNKIKNRRISSCLKKKRYSTKELAQKLITEGLERGTQLFKYHCHYCGGWHLTKQHKKG